MPDLPPWNLADRGMTRFPPNVESLSVEWSGDTAILAARRNDTVLRFPLDVETRLHLVRLLSKNDNGEAA